MISASACQYLEADGATEDCFSASVRFFLTGSFSGLLLMLGQEKPFLNQQKFQQT